MPHQLSNRCATFSDSILDHKEIDHARFLSQLFTQSSQCEDVVTWLLFYSLFYGQMLNYITIQAYNSKGSVKRHKASLYRVIRKPLSWERDRYVNKVVNAFVTGNPSLNNIKLDKIKVGICLSTTFSSESLSNLCHYNHTSDLSK